MTISDGTKKVCSIGLQYFMQLAEYVRLPVISWTADNSAFEHGSLQLQLAPTIKHQVGLLMLDILSIKGPILQTKNKNSKHQIEFSLYYIRYPMCMCDLKPMDKS